MEHKKIHNLVQTFVLSGLTVSGISYVGNNLNPLAAGIISGIPISIPSMLTVSKREDQKKFIWSAFVMVSFLAIITGLCAFLVLSVDMASIPAVVISFASWCIGAYIYYLYVRSVPGKK